MDGLTELFCQIDDFCREFGPAGGRRLAAGAKTRKRDAGLGLSELMALAVLFHRLRFRQFKRFCRHYACRRLRREFPKLPGGFRAHIRFRREVCQGKTPSLILQPPGCGRLFRNFSRKRSVAKGCGVFSLSVPPCP
jgi:hypothetical protein